VERLRDAQAFAPLAALMVQQVDEPLRERTLRDGIARLTDIDEPTSRAVQAQYEANPYPRWVKAGAPSAARTVQARLRELLPRAGALAAQVPLQPQVLIAGCGTGQEAVETALQWPAARILAVDLSVASLAHAARKAQEHGVEGIAFAQADLLALPRLGRRFDVVSCVGVLHHLADPPAGLRALAACLARGGVMQLGFYSARARRAVDAARARVEAAGLRPSPEGIRAARRLLLALPADDPAAAVTSIADFHATSACRDLLMHAQERSYSLPEVGAMLDAAGLALAGLAVDPAVGREYDRFNAGHDAQRVDLARWDAYEALHPGTFAGMYVLWVRRR
jgi:2-polyprenyl-3-methyl-5-hydroxy-6-metoxy-1,4-benzoquinol methylase